MRALNPMRSRRRATDDLRLAVRCLPRATRLAMLEGVARNPIIVGAYSTPDGICPMLAAHRAGGRASLIAFAEAWDRFAAGAGRRRRARPATVREVLVLRAHLEASLLEEEAGGPGLAGAIAEHRELLRGRREAREAARARPREAGDRGRGARPGDPDRRSELQHARGWAWSRLFRRYDDYVEALDRLEAPPRTAAHDSSCSV